MSNIVTSAPEIKKLQVTEAVLFAINHIPEADQSTLEKFLDLVHATGTFGAISHEQLLNKMRLTLKYIPEACPHALLILADLLEMPRSSPPPLRLNGPEGLARIM